MREYDEMLRQHAAQGSELQRVLDRHLSQLNRWAEEAHAGLPPLSSAGNPVKGIHVLKGGAIVAGVGLAVGGLYALHHHRKKQSEAQWTSRIEAERQDPSIIVR